MTHSRATKLSALLTVAGLVAVSVLFVRFQPTTALAAEDSFSAATHTFIKFNVPGAGKNKGQGTIGRSVADDGSIAGWFYDSNSVSHGFLRSPSGKFSKFDPSGSLGTLPKSINSKLAIVGFYTDSNGVYHGFLRSPQGKLTRLDDPKAGKGSGQGTLAWNINTSGEIVGYYFDANTIYHGFASSPISKLREPVPVNIRERNLAALLTQGPSAGLTMTRVPTATGSCAPLTVLSRLSKWRAVSVHMLRT